MFKNVIKYTLIYDKIRKGMVFYLLSLLKELLNCEDKYVLRQILLYKNKNLYNTVFITLVLMNKMNFKIADGLNEYGNYFH